MLDLLRKNATGKTSFKYMDITNPNVIELFVEELAIVYSYANGSASDYLKIRLEACKNIHSLRFCNNKWRLERSRDSGEILYSIRSIAKNNFIHENLSNQFSEHTIERKYQTLVWGKLRPSNGRIETLIKRSSKNRQLMSVSLSRGKNSITNYKTLEIFEKDTIPTFSLVECKLETGRTHQIRVHMSYKGNNILGDKKYKKKFKKIKNINLNLKKLIYNLGRQFLHAKVIGFIHPKSGKKLRFSSVLPNDLMNIVKTLRNIDK